MTMDRSLKVQAGAIKTRNVMTRAERVARLKELDRFDPRSEHCRHAQGACRQGFAEEEEESEEGRRDRPPKRARNSPLSLSWECRATRPIFSSLAGGMSPKDASGFFCATCRRARSLSGGATKVVFSPASLWNYHRAYKPTFGKQTATALGVAVNRSSGYGGSAFSNAGHPWLCWASCESRRDSRVGQAATSQRIHSLGTHRYLAIPPKPTYLTEDQRMPESLLEQEPVSSTRIGRSGCEVKGNRPSAIAAAGRNPADQDPVGLRDRAGGGPPDRALCLCPLVLHLVGVGAGDRGHFLFGMFGHHDRLSPFADPSRIQLPQMARALAGAAWDLQPAGQPGTMGRHSSDAPSAQRQAARSPFALGELSCGDTWDGSFADIATWTRPATTSATFATCFAIRST